MQLTVILKLFPTDEQTDFLRKTLNQYINDENCLLDYYISVGKRVSLTSATFHSPLPAALRNQVVRDASSIYNTATKADTHLTGKFPVLRKPMAIWNNQNYTITDSKISMPVLTDSKSQRVKIKAQGSARTWELLKTSKLGTLRITVKNGKYVAQVAYEVIENPKVVSTKAMGVDLGIKCPAVIVHENGATKFVGNGRQIKQVRRKYNNQRKKLMKHKKMKALKKLGNKENRWMRDVDHKISRSIVNEAIKNNVGIIKLEALSGIRRTTSKSRKNNHSLHSWSFYRLAQFIEYKARIAGIQIIYVNPAYTSQRCPHCGSVNHADDRKYVCENCGYHSHRDRIGAVNILAA